MVPVQAPLRAASHGCLCPLPNQCAALRACTDPALWSRSVSRWLVPRGARPSLARPRRMLFFRRAGGLTWFCTCPESSTNQSLLNSRFPCTLLPPACSPLLGDDNPYGSLKHYFLSGLSVAGHLVSPGLPTSPRCPQWCSGSAHGVKAAHRRLRPCGPLAPIPSLADSELSLSSWSVWEHLSHSVVTGSARNLLPAK